MKQATNELYGDIITCCQTMNTSQRLTVDECFEVTCQVAVQLARMSGRVPEEGAHGAHIIKALADGCGLKNHAVFNTDAMETI